MDMTEIDPSEWLWAVETVDTLVAKLVDLLARGVVIADMPGQP